MTLYQYLPKLVLKNNMFGFDEKLSNRNLKRQLIPYAILFMAVLYKIFQKLSNKETNGFGETQTTEVF